MNIPIKTGVTADCPSIPVETGDSNIPRKPILFEGGDIPAVINSLSVTENGTYTAPAGVDGYNPVEVNVPTPVLTTLNATENGTYYPEEGVTGFNEVNVEVPDVPPVLETLNVTANGTYTPEEGVDGFNVVNVNVDNVTSKILSQFDFSEAEYDLVRSINPTSAEPLSRARLDIGLYNATYDSTNGVVSWTNGYGCCYPFVQFEKYKDYKIIIEFGNIQRSDSNQREFLQIGASCRVGEGNTGIWRANSSGTEVWSGLTLAGYVANKKIEIKCTWGHGAGTNTPTSYWYIKFPGDTYGWRFLCNVEYNADTNLRIGRATSNNGCYPGEVKNIEVIESKWIISPAEETITDVAVATFNNAYLNSTLKNAVVTIDDASGITGAKISLNGINQWDEEWELGTINVNNGSEVEDNTRIRNKGFISILPNITYHFTVPVNDGRIVFYDRNKNYLTQLPGSTIFTNKEFTAPAGAYYVRFSTVSAYGVTYNNDISINYPSTITSYNKYVGNTYSATFEDSGTPITITDGTFDFATGVLTDNTTTPATTYNLGTTNIDTLYELNNVFSDAGNVTITYLKEV